MRKWVCVICGILLLLTGCAKQPSPSGEVIQTEESAPADATYILYFTETLLRNDSVGNDWQITYTCDGKAIVSGEQRVVPVGTIQTLTIEVTVTEEDTRPDVGYGTLTAVLQDGRTSSVTLG